MHSRTTGAALVIAIGIIAILLAIGFTFYFVSRVELYTAELAVQNAQSEELLRGAFNIAISTLNEDLNRHPDASSPDHAWRSLYSGAWIAGKRWGIRYPRQFSFALGGTMQWKNAIPHIDVARPWIHFPALNDFMRNIESERRFIYVQFSDGYRELLYNGPRSKEWLFYPRVERIDAPIVYDNDAVLVLPPSRNSGDWESIPQRIGNTYLYYRVDIQARTSSEVQRDGDLSRADVPFLLPTMYGRSSYPDGQSIFGGVSKLGKNYATDSMFTPEWIDAWADVDLDGDGFRDAIWLPLAADALYSGITYDITGEIRINRNDGIDNNLNGLIDEAPDNEINEEYIDNRFDGSYVTFFASGEQVNDPTDYVSSNDPKKPGLPDPEELFELAVFIYWGGKDRLDNNCNGLVDEDEEKKLFLTTPLLGLRIKVDWNADGVINKYDMVPDENGNLVYLEVIMPSELTIKVWDYEKESFDTFTVTANDVDCLDNDYDLLVNNFDTYAYVGPNNLGLITIAGEGSFSPPFQLRGFTPDGVPIYDKTKRNQAGSEDYRYAKYAMPGNWNKDDEFKYRSARASAFYEINHFLSSNGNPFIPGISIYPESGSWIDPSTSNTGSANIDYTALLPYIHITHTGEPMCDLVGRMAVLIKDESSKVNLNYSGGHYPIDFTFNDPFDGLPQRLRRVYFSPDESSQWLIGYGLETRFLPNVGVIRSQKIWNLLTGTPAGQINPARQDYRMDVNGSLYYDALFPGDGGIDDNANAFLLLTNGLDDDGDGIIDNGVNEVLGILEGIDEPGELQQSKPYLNRFAKDGVDNDRNGQIDEFGELGDRIIGTVDQISELDDYGVPGTTEYQKVVNAITTFGGSYETKIRRFGEVLRGVMPLNLNYATPVQIATNFIFAQKPASSTNEIRWRTDGPSLDARYFAEGLRSYENEWQIWFPEANNERGFLFSDYESNTGLPISAIAGNDKRFPVDPILAVMQLAVNLVDIRDKDIVQSRLTTEKVAFPLMSNEDRLFNPSRNLNTLSTYELNHNRSNINLRELEKYVKETMFEPNVSWAINDYWWANRVRNTDNGTTRGDLRAISYTVAGVESLRITEIMARPVRRVEAERDVYQTLYNYYSDEYPPGIPLFLYDVERLTDRFENEGIQRLWTVASDSVLGKGNYVRTRQSTFTLGEPEDENSRISMPNVIEYRFRASTALPAGRYYLMINTNKERFGTSTLTRDGTTTLRYAIKYCAVNVNQPNDFTDDEIIDPTIIDDVYEFPTLVDDDSVFQKVKSSWIGVNARGETTGMVFLPGQLETDSTEPREGYWLDGITQEDQPVNNYKTFTVTIPPYTPNDGIQNDYVLCIAFWLEEIEETEEIEENGDFVINFFDFSQEPDHEFIEITNISDQPIDVTGFKIEIGVPRDAVGYRSDPYKVIGTIGNPNATSPTERYIIAPKGRLLLTFDSSGELPNDKFDHFQNPNLTSPLNSIIKRNGIGLCRIATLDPATISEELRPLLNITTPLCGLVPDASNVFSRDYIDFVDFVDYNYDGVIDNNSPDNDIQSTPDDFYFGLEGANKPWDRIVPLFGVSFPLIDGEDTVKDFKIDYVKNVDHLAKLVLQGGIIPNYPEHDGYDNDGDGGFFNRYGNYIFGALEKDGVDNDLDGIVDNRPPNQNLTEEGTDWLLNEGVDEGRLKPLEINDQIVYVNTNGRRYGFGSYESGVLPAYYVNDMSSIQPTPTNPVGGNVLVDFLTDPYNQNSPPNVTSGLNSNLNPDIRAPYMGADEDPPPWKAFVERRWNPGDCVVVCLYNPEGKLIDGVTYNEYDVINRAIDDILPAPSEMQLNVFFPTWWIPDCMLWDFCKSLRRKHPELAGDRFGLSNRWEATDGYYDDWEETVNIAEQLIYPGIGQGNINNFPLFNYTNNRPYRQKTDLPYVRNAFYCSPLGRSFTEIVMNSKVYSSPTLSDSIIINGRGIQLQYPFWNIERPRETRRMYTGSLSRVLLPVMTKYMISTSKMVTDLSEPNNRYLFDLGRINLAFFSVVPAESFWRQVWENTRVVVGQYQDNEKYTDKLIKDGVNIATISEKVLTVGTAEFIPIRPNPNERDVFPEDTNFQDMLRFSIDQVGNYDFPEAWVPLFLFLFEGERYTYPRFADGSIWNGNYPLPYPVLFNSEIGRSWIASVNSTFGRPMLDPTTVARKWDIQKRIFAYGSYCDLPNFDPNRPEALFIWDSEDGVENGDYYVYLGFINPYQVERLREYNARLYSGAEPPPYELFSRTFGERWINLEVNPEPVQVAVEVITDPAYFRGLRQRGDFSGSGLTHPDDWARSTEEGVGESFIYEPNNEGILYYGRQDALFGLPKTVRITQRSLALRIRNICGLCYFTHLILVPNKKSYHKININTVEPYIYRHGQQFKVYNSAMTLPGMFYQTVYPPKDSDFNNPNYDVNPIPVSTNEPNVTYPDSLQGFILSNYHLTYLLMENRPEWVDGRYYRSVLDLANTGESNYLLPLSVINRYNLRPADVLRRFESLADHVSLRSDVFEIIALVQSGYGIDADKSGFISYRTNEEFVVESEAKGRIIYDRSVPTTRYEED